MDYGDYAPLELTRFLTGGKIIVSDQGTTFEALERAQSLAAERQRKEQEGPAMGACGSFRLSHTMIFPPVRKAVNSN